MAITYISIITLTIKALNAPTKTDLLNGYKNKAHICAIYRRPTSDIGTYKD